MSDSKKDNSIEGAENWLNFNFQMRLIDDLFSNGCFVAAHREVKRLEKFVKIFATRAMEKEERERRESNEKENSTV